MSDGADRLLDTLIDEIVASRSFAEKLWRLSTARLQEMRREVDAELAARMAPHEDLRDGFALGPDRGEAGRT